MLATSYATLKKAKNAGPRIVGIGTAGLPWPYLEKVFEQGALSFLDVVSVHPYRYEQTPEGIEEEILQLDALVRQYNKGLSKPIWATEYGWGTLTPAEDGELAITELDQAKFLVRAHALLLAGGAEKAFWYLFQETPEFPSMGLIHGSDHPQGGHTPKPAYVSYATLIRQLDGAQFVEREPAGPGIYCLRFQDSAERVVRVLWSVNRASLRVRVPPDTSVMLTDLMGKESGQPAGELALALTDAPIYLRGGVEGLPVPGAVHEEPSPPLLADSVTGFSESQGKGGWFYGYESNGRFEEFAQYRITDWTREWIEDAIPWISINPTYQHPSAQDGRPIAAVRRWRSQGPVRATISVDAKLANRQGDGITFRIRQDGRVVFDRKLGGGGATRLEHSFVTTLERGSMLDFIVDPGPGTDYNFDGTILRARVVGEAR
jgi:hypothetical protein